MIFRRSTFLIVMIISSCTEEFEIEYTAQESKLAVHGIVYEGRAIQINISHTLLYDHETAFEIVPNATVLLFEDSKFVDKLQHTKNGFYRSEFIPNKHHTYRLEIEHDIYKNATAEVSFEDSVPAQILHYNTETEILDFADFEIALELNDNASTFNFYSLNPWYYEVFNNDTIKSRAIMWTQDEKFITSIYQNEEGSSTTMSDKPFPDIMFNGDKLTVNFNVMLWHDPALDDSLFLDVYIYSKEYSEYNYDYYNQMFHDDFFSEPVFMYSNIENGVGVLASATKKTYKIYHSGKNNSKQL